MRPAVFLDRDGTVIASVHYLADPERREHRAPEQLDREVVAVPTAARVLPALAHVACAARHDDLGNDVVVRVLGAQFQHAVHCVAESGKLAELQEKWLNEAQNVPTLK